MYWFNNLKMKTKLLVMVGISVLSLCASIATAVYVLQRVKVNGPIFHSIVQQKDLLADILPPPEYVIESYLTVLESLHAANQAELSSYVEKFKKLQGDYVTRHEYWAKVLPDGRIKQLLLTGSYAPAMEFYKIANQQFFPALEKGDVNTAKTLVEGKLKASYLAHRKAINKLVILANQKSETLEAGARKSLSHSWLLLGIISLGGLGLTVLISIMLVRVLNRQLGGDPAVIADIAAKVAGGDLRIDFQSDRKEETGVYAAMKEMVQQLKEVVDAMRRLANGDLTFEVTPKDERDLVRGALKKLGEDLNVLVAQIQTSGEQIASGSAQISDSSQSLSQGATESASSLEEISASMNQLSSQTKRNAENATQANLLSSESKKAAATGNLQMQEMMTAMTEIQESSQNISKIIKVIDEIAFQTNLLALNAAVEAARAGQHGKGFAVVAEEVRNLAARSARAAKETADLIEGSVARINKGSQIAGQTADALGEIVTGVGKVTDLVEEIAAASNEQAQGIAQVSQGLTQIDQVTQQNTAYAEEGSASAEELSGQAAQLKAMLEQFKLAEGSKGATSPRSLKPEPKAVGGKPEPVALSWGGDAMARSGGNPSNVVIALDDEEFGKY